MRPLFALLLLLPHLFTGALSARSHPNAATVPDGYPFLFGAQYYRAPTPETECWETDLSRMKELGFTDVKFWVQWRWNNRRENEYDFGDLDRLTDLAEKNGLRVTFNTIFDVAPVWLYEKYPDAKQLANDGRRIEPYTVGHRQGGGHPGPCYNHPGALEARISATAKESVSGTSGTNRNFRSRSATRSSTAWSATATTAGRNSSAGCNGNTATSKPSTGSGAVATTTGKKSNCPATRKRSRTSSTGGFSTATR